MLPVKRTVAARRLGKILCSQSIEPLCTALENEKLLYCRLELCRTLTLFGKEAVSHLIQRLGKVPNNQYKKPATKKFSKKSYPLPRDIFARILINIGSDALPYLCEAIRIGKPEVISEAIDATGHICFYDKQEHQDMGDLLLSCYQKYADNDLIRWKLIRAMSAFPKFLPLLEHQRMVLASKELKQEAERSIELIKSKR